MDVVTLGAAMKYCDGKLNTGQFVGTVVPGGSFPTTRLDGTPLINDDYVKPLSSATFPFTVAGVTFVNRFTNALYLNGAWFANPGLVQDTNETPVKNSAIESISGTSVTQAAINTENKVAIGNKVDRLTTPFTNVYGHDGTTQTEFRVNTSPMASNIPQYSTSATLTTSTPASSLDCANKNYVDTTTVPKQHDVSHANELLKINASGAVGYKDPADFDPVWGNITGTLSNQTDVYDYINTKTTLDEVKTYAQSTYVPKQHDAAKAGKLLSINSTGVVDYKDTSDLTPVWGNITGTLTNQADLNAALSLKVAYTDVQNTVTSTATNLPLSAKMGKELQEQINSLSSMGRFLSTWNCRTGLPSTNPTVMPYSYKTGDYYIVSVVAASGGTNYKPSGSQYTGVASTAIESGEVHENDFYQYDGTVWMKLSHSAQTVTFSQVAGDPYGNISLAAALNAKYEKPSSGIPKTDLASDTFALYRQSSEQDIIDNTKVDKVAGKGLSTDDFDEDLYYNKVTVDAKIASITATFRGSFANHSALIAYSGAKNKNDYAYVEADETHSGQKWRYTYDGTQWVAEYRLDSVTVWGTVSGSIEDQADLFTKFYKKAEVDEKISSNAATFRGSFASKAALMAYAGEKKNNDYSVVLDDESHSHECWRYKYNGSAWISEYRVNETAITADQYAAMNSGVTSAKVVTYTAHVNSTNNPHSVTKAQIGLSDVNNTADIDKPISTATQTALNAKITNPSGGTTGQILKKTTSGEGWSDQYPTGTEGQILKKTASGEIWSDQYPTGTEGQILKKTATGEEWAAQYPTGTEGQILKKTSTAEEWTDQYPTGTAGDVLTKTDTGVEFAASCPTRANSTDYTVDKKVTYPGDLYVLKCVTAGTSDATLPALPTDIQSGITELTDGTVTWVIYDVTASGAYVPQLTEFPMLDPSSPLSFQYIGEEPGYNQFSHYKKVVENYVLSCTFGTFYSTVEPPEEPSSCALYDDEECTVLNADYTANNNGAQFIVTKVSTSETANANLAGGSHYEEIAASVDAYTKDESDARYLQLSGGTMTGLLVAKDGGGTADGIRTAVDNSQLMICGGTDNTGATIWLNGKNRSAEPGCFNIRAMNGTTTCDLFGNTAGQLY